MKKKILIETIAFMVLFTFSSYKVQAYSGEIDPQGYITLPTTIYITNGIGTGTISVSESDYIISYQKQDITVDTYSNIIAKQDEYNSYYESAEAELDTKYDEITTLKTEYDDLVESGTATDEEIQTALTNYNAALSEYEELVSNANSKLEEIQEEFYALIPDYGSSWIETTNSSNNLSLDFTEYLGTLYFILWVKIDNGTNTYYDFNIYSNTVQESEASSADDSSTINVEQMSDVRKYRFTTSSIPYKSGHTYYYFIGDENDSPEFSTDLPQLSYNETEEIFYSMDISSYLELSDDWYVYIYDYYLNDSTEIETELIVNKVLLEKPEQKKYTDAFYGTMIAKLSDDAQCSVQIMFDTPWGSDTIRKIHLRIGKISDDTILKNIYYNSSNAFEKLLQYGQSATAFYDETVDSNDGGLTTAGGYLTSSTEPLFSASYVTDGEYYFLYAVVEDENGKYVETEGITFARASKSSSQTNSFSLFFYGSDNFSWKTFDLDSESETNSISGSDSTTATTSLPYTGIETVVVIIMIASITCGIHYYSKYNKYKGI